MALAETILRKANKLGLFPKVIAKLPVVSLVFALVSVCWLLLLPMDGQFRHTYISENALMPGQVNSYFRESEWNHVRGFRAETAKWAFDQVSHENPQLEAWLRDFGLTVSHHFDAKTNSSTMYALMHAPRGDDTESLVLVTPYFTSSGEENIGGLALAPALARYFSRMSIWSKNIIFVFPKDGHSVLRSWVEAYHTTLDVTAGSIEAAIVMEYPLESDNFSHLEIIYEGLNGQLPNLDLINVATTVARHENMKVSVQGTSHENLDRSDYWSRLEVLARGIFKLAVTGVNRKSYGCEAFSGWQIQAITVKAVGTGGPDVTQFGRIVDSSFRSVNNLLEKFHQSFFFYLLLSPTHFVSIGTYLPSAVLLGASFLVSSLYSFARGVSAAEFLSSIGSVLRLFSAIEAVCIVGAVFLQNLAVSSADPEPVAQAITVALIAFTVVLSTGSLTFGALKLRVSRPASYLILSFALYFIAMLIVALLIVHFALAFSIGISALPLTFIQDLLMQTHGSGAALLRTRLKVVLCLVVSSPITAVVLLGYILDGGKTDGVLGLVHGLLSSWHEMQSWTWFVLALGWLPAWVAVALVCAFGDFSVPVKQKNE
ncbi:Gaa1-domain-containing protein [Metschnikowia bicuspidata var. bicuspidata NRRL YB-4993]|uniref:Gaa1-domain-containing protein n=1 Tax=Metschnikowia bicuspidata var. bicuspidata NRRL YB-4993 TaxID=869754 RepID=A0A1A0H844_9ASCO|nr:Gaa1-domain-containing protein [Metschnikowia bicuspidata var. bicuspidata NRRL YB-4993]OBA20191.1 Gaa1-domain-containing protein [Metschnikowia bicuspidata var. bicuspidata NRRL YB-4993]